MTKTNILRIALYAALGYILISIWQSWSLYSDENQRLLTSSVTDLSGSSEQSAMEDVPISPQKESNTDVPTLSAAADRETKVVTTNEEIIDIKTDVLHLKISSVGGTIIYAALLKHPTQVETPDDPVVLLKSTNTDVYVAQSGLIGPPEHSFPNHNTRYQIDKTNYSLSNQNDIKIPLLWVSPEGVEHKKIYTVRKNDYRIDLTHNIKNLSETTWTGYFYGQLKQTEVVPQQSMGIFGQLPSYNGAAIYTAEEKYEKIDYDEIEESDLDLPTTGGWASMLQHYFVGAWLAKNDEKIALFSGYQNKNSPLYRIGYKQTVPTNVQPGDESSIKSALYIGPKDQKRLDAQQVDGLKLTVDYGWLTPVSAPLFWLLTKIYDVVKNWGLAIILLTLAVKLAFLPLSAKSYKSMANMKRLQPRMATLKERYGSDKQRYQQEVMKLYKTEKVNPAGGCLPLLVQAPVFIALYWVLLESVELRQANFIGWLNDLSSPDPFYILPILMGISMFVQQKLNPAPMDPIQQKVMMAFPVVLTLLFLWFPSGLVLYWVANNILSILQQYYIGRRYK